MKLYLKNYIRILFFSIIVVAIIVNNDYLQERIFSRPLPAYNETKVKATREQKSPPAYDETKIPILISSKKCENNVYAYCCGDGTWNLGLESYSTCPEDVGSYFSDLERPIVKAKDNSKVSVICIDPCPYTDEVFNTYSEKFFQLYNKLISFVGHYPPLFADPYYQPENQIPFNKYKYPPITVILGDSNYEGEYVMQPSAGGEYAVKLGCPTGLCYVNTEDYVYKS